MIFIPRRCPPSGPGGQGSGVAGVQSGAFERQMSATLPLRRRGDSGKAERLSAAPPLGSVKSTPGVAKPVHEV